MDGVLKEERTEIGNKYLRMYFYNMGPCPPRSREIAPFCGLCGLSGVPLGPRAVCIAFSQL